MKKIFTLLFTTAMLSTAFAQYSQKDQRDWNKGDGRDVYASNDNHGGFDRYDRDNHGTYYFTEREKDMQITQINREYDYKIQGVKNRFFMSWFQKRQIINDLSMQRNGQIGEVMQKFNSPRNQFGDYRRDDKRRW